MKLINPLVIIRILSTILLIATVSFLVCLPVSLIYGEESAPFLLSSLISGTAYAIFRISSIKAGMEKITARDGFIAVTMSWLVFTAAGSLPYILSGTIPSFIDAFFESVSGFTTTGASILNDIESLPYSILFWRNFTQWIGGLGIIVLVIIILPSLGITGQQLMGLESSLREKIHPRTKAIGFRLLIIYLGLTAAEIILLMFGEMDLFESICHTLGTVSTGGFSTRNTSIMEYSAYSQYIIALFMLMSGVSFVVYYYVIKMQFSKVKHDDELWFYLKITAGAGILAMVILIAQSGRAFEPAFREGFFQAISIITTTGFVTTDYLLWPQAGTILLFTLMFAGASTGSTTGSIKMARHLIVIRNIKDTLKKLTHSSIITQVKLNRKTISEKNNMTILTFVGLYLFIFVTGTVIITITGLDPVDSASGVAACLGNVGPALGSLGPMYNYSDIPGISKLVFSLLMIIGRLEILTAFALFSRSFWKI